MKKQNVAKFIGLVCSIAFMSWLRSKGFMVYEVAISWLFCCTLYACCTIECSITKPQGLMGIFKWLVKENDEETVVILNELGWHKTVGRDAPIVNMSLRTEKASDLWIGDKE